MDAILTSQQIGETLRVLRKRRGFTQEQLAEKINVTFQQIQQYESGSTRLNTDKLQLLANALDVPVMVFFEKGDVERSLTEEEQRLITGFRAIPSSDTRSFILNCLSNQS